MDEIRLEALRLAVATSGHINNHRVVLEAAQEFYNFLTNAQKTA